MGFLSKLFGFDMKQGKNSSTTNNKSNSKSEQITFTEKDMEQYNLPYEISAFDSSITNSISVNKNNQLQAINDVIMVNNFLDWAYENKYIKIKYQIPINTLCFSSSKTDCSKLILQPYTKTGKKSKYPLILNYKTKGCHDFNPPFSYFGEISYMQDGNIGKVRAICWIKQDMCVLNLGLIGSTLSVKNIEVNDKNTGEKLTVYKA